MKARVFAEVVICYGVGGVGESDKRCGGDDFLVSLGIWWFGGGFYVSV